jgi:leucyl-tRNA synthetase
MQRAREAAPVDTAAWDEAVTTMLKLVAPLAPHVAEELWERRGGVYSVHQQRWPEFDASLAHEDTVDLVLQVNGKVRDRLPMAAGATEAEARAIAMASPRVQEFLAGATPRRIIYVPGKLINIVV